MGDFLVHPRYFEQWPWCSRGTQTAALAVVDSSFVDRRLGPALGYGDSLALGLLGLYFVRRTATLDDRAAGFRAQIGTL